MNYKKVVLAVAVASLIAIAGCAETTGSNGDDLAKDTGSDISNVSMGESYTYEVKMTEKNQYGLVKSQPPFVMDSSLERENLIRRYQYLNDKDNVHHVYLTTENGQVMSYFVAQGKVSSVNSKLTNNQQIVRSNQCRRDTYREDESGCYKTVESPQMDGSYGTNGDAIFFFTTSGEYVEWNGQYLVSEEPKNIQSQVILTESVDEEEDNSTESGD